MFTFTKTATSDLRQAYSPTSGSSEVNLRLYCTSFYFYPSMFMMRFVIVLLNEYE